MNYVSMMFYGDYLVAHAERQQDLLSQRNDVSVTRQEAGARSPPLGVPSKSPSQETHELQSQRNYPKTDFLPNLQSQDKFMAP